MDIIVKANRERFGDGKMCQAMEEILEPRIKEREMVSRAEGEAKQIIAMSYEFGLSKDNILDRLQNGLGLSLQKAQEYMLMFGK